MKSKIKKIKKQIKVSNNWKEYKVSFKVKKMFLFLSKVTLIFDNDFSIDVLAQLENKLSTNIDDFKMWGEIFNESLTNINNEFKNCDWKSFGVFAFYVWNQWKYHNKKTRNKSIYDLNNFNELNNVKTLTYNNWMNSVIQIKRKDFNEYVRKVLKLI